MERIIIQIFKEFIDQNCYGVELRHILGMLFDDDGNPIPLDKELQMFKRIIAKMQLDYPWFVFRVSV